MLWIAGGEGLPLRPTGSPQEPSQDLSQLLPVPENWEGLHLVYILLGQKFREAPPQDTFPTSPPQK